MGEYLWRDRRKSLYVKMPMFARMESEAGRNILEFHPCCRYTRTGAISKSSISERLRYAVDKFGYISATTFIPTK